MVKRCDAVRPRNRIVAAGAVGHGKRRTCRRVRRVVGLLPRRQMAARVAAVSRRNRQLTTFFSWRMRLPPSLAIMLILGIVNIIPALRHAGGMDRVFVMR